MSASNLATTLLVIFIVFLFALVAELIYVLRSRRSFHRHSTPTHGSDQTSDSPTKEQLLYFFCLKSSNNQVKLNPSGSPIKIPNGSSKDNDEVVDVLKLLEANGPSKILCTIKEEDQKKDVESTREVDFVINKPLTLSEQVVVTVDGDDDDDDDDDDDGTTKTVFSTPCDSPTFFTPVGSPTRDVMESALDDGRAT